jgi:hypothetical protein
MSLRGLHFVREWISTNVDLTLNYPYATRRAQMLATACRLDANSKQIGIQEIEDETGDLEEVLTRVLTTRDPVI